MRRRRLHRWQPSGRNRSPRASITRSRDVPMTPPQISSPCGAGATVLMEPGDYFIKIRAVLCLTLPLAQCRTGALFSSNEIDQRRHAGMPEAFAHHGVVFFDLQRGEVAERFLQQRAGIET